MHFYPSKWKLLGLLGLTALLVGMGLVCTRLPDPGVQIMGWVGVVFFGLGFLVLPARLLRRGPVVTIDEAGIIDRRLRAGPIRWEEVQAVEMRAVNRTRFLCVWLVDPEPYLARLPWSGRRVCRLNARLGFGHVAISFIDLTPGLDAAWATVGAVYKGAAPQSWEDEP